jgi:hypothetical protein
MCGVTNHFEVQASQLSDLTWDGFKLRAQPVAELAVAWDRVCLLRQKNPTKAQLPVHRDTWGSNIPSQINWYVLVRTTLFGKLFAHFRLVAQ